MVLMNLTDMLKLMNRMGVRVVNDLTAQVTVHVTAAMDPGFMGVHISSVAPSVDIEMSTPTVPISLFALPSTAPILFASTFPWLRPRALTEQLYVRE